MTQLVAGTSRNDHVAERGWAWYYYDAHVQDGVVADFQVTIEQSGDGDTDLYVKYEELPLLWDYDYRNALVVDSYALTVGSPDEGRYYIGVYGYTVEGDADLSYTIGLTVSAGEDCESKCSSHGYCSAGACHCEGPYEGDNCEISRSPPHVLSRH